MTNHPKFVIKPIPGKGMGVVATGPIAKGEVVLSEAPLFTQRLGWNMLTIVRSLYPKTDDEKRQFLELTTCHQGRLPLYVGIFQTNALPCGNNGRREIASAAGLFLQGSRFNSSCVPNVSNYWNERRQMIGFRALRDIAEGEELCITYTAEMMSRANRRSELRKNFGFECRCAACSLSDDELRASDNRRTTLDRLYDEIGQCGNRPAVGMQKVKTALRLLKEEGLVHGEDTFSYDAFQFCVVTLDLIHAKAWIQKAWKAESIAYGEDSEAARKYKKYIKHPKTHPSWGLGLRMTLEGPDD